MCIHVRYCKKETLYISLYAYHTGLGSVAFHTRFSGHQKYFGCIIRRRTSPIYVGVFWSNNIIEPLLNIKFPLWNWLSGLMRAPRYPFLFSVAFPAQPESFRFVFFFFLSAQWFFGKRQKLLINFRCDRNGLLLISDWHSQLGACVTDEITTTTKNTTPEVFDVIIGKIINRCAR